MKIKDLSLSDLKAAYDFVLLHLAEMKEKADEKNVPTSTISAYKEMKLLESDLWHELLNKTSNLE